MANIEYKKIPELKKMVDLAQYTVFTARQQNTLGSLTVKTVRRRVEEYFGLEEGVLEREDLKVALRNAVNKALEDSTKGQEDVEDSESESTPYQPASAKNKEEIIPNMKSKVESKETSTSKEQVTGRVIHTQRYLPMQTARRTKQVKNEDGEENTSDVSSTIDNEQPKKKRRTSKASADDKNKELAETPEETVERLKSLVNACGRKPSWQREFAGPTEPGQQIRHLKKMLSDLGMRRNYTIQAARAIKHERELARELKDVIEFEKKAGLSRRRRQDRRGELDTETEDEVVANQK